MSGDSKANAIEQYGFLYALANDDIISEAELAFMQKLALSDGRIDREEKKVLCRLLSRVNINQVDTALRENLETFANDLECGFVLA